MRYHEFLIEYKSQAAINAILNKHGTKIADKLKSDLKTNQNVRLFGDVVDPNKLIDLIISYDPTKKSIYTDWLIERYIAGDFRYLEDIGKATSLLKFYEKAKPKLPVEQRDIRYFKSFNQLYDFVDQLKSANIDTTSNKEKTRNFEKELLDSGEAEIFYNSPDIKIIIPKTERASCYFGKNTRWCTAADENNEFDNYSSDGDLYILLFKKENKRWQFHFESAQFMDELDDPLTPEEVKSVGHLFKGTYIDPNAPDEVKIVAVNKLWYAIKYISNPSEKVQIAAINASDDAIRFIENPSEDVQLAAVKQNGYLVRAFKNPSEEVQLAAVQYTGHAISYIKNPSEQVQLAAVNQTEYSILYITHPTPKVQKYIAKHHPKLIKHIKNPIPEIKKLQQG